jgi:hypothetical protein
MQGVMRKKQKILIVVLLLGTAYLLSFIAHAIENTKVWSGDTQKYIVYSNDQLALYLIHKPLLYLVYYGFGRMYVVGHHTDPDGNKYGYYY